MPKNSGKLIVITGATGQQGGAALRQLREKGFPVRALTRHPDRPKARALVRRGTEVVRGNLDDPVSIMRAFEGAYGVFAVLTPMEEGVPNEVSQGINVTDVAKRAGVSHLVYSSVGSADRKTGIPHFDSKFQ